MIDKRFIGHVMPAFSAEVEKGRLRFFAKATGQTDPVYADEAAAHAAGYPSLPVPPTFLFCLEMEAPDPAAIRNLLGMDYRTLLHGEQGFRYHRMAFAGDTLTLRAAHRRHLRQEGRGAGVRRAQDPRDQPARRGRGRTARRHRDPQPPGGLTP